MTGFSDGYDRENWRTARARGMSTSPTCTYCNDTGHVAVHASNLTYAFPGPVPDHAKGYADADCWHCDCANPPNPFRSPTKDRQMNASATEREWIIDADMSRDGFFAFCPIERNTAGDVVAVVTGMTFLSDKPPHNEKCIGVWSEEGEESAHAFFEANKDQLRQMLPPIPGKAEGRTP